MTRSARVLAGPLVYLAGPITGLTYGGSTEWRDAAIAELAEYGIHGLSPMRGKDYLLQHTTMSDAFDQYVLSTQKAITVRDRFDCQRSDVVFVNLLGAEKVSIGTMIELGWADSARVPLVVAMDDGNVHDHAMVRELAGFTVSSIAEGLWVCKTIVDR